MTRKFVLPTFEFENEPELQTGTDRHGMPVYGSGLGTIRTTQKKIEGYALAAVELNKHLIIADFLESTGQWVTNEETHNKAIQEAVEADRRAGGGPAKPWRAHEAAIDAKALSTAQEIALMWGNDRSQFVSHIQLAVLDAMKWVQESNYTTPRPKQILEGYKQTIKEFFMRLDTAIGLEKSNSTWSSNPKGTLEERIKAWGEVNRLRRILEAAQQAEPDPAPPDFQELAITGTVTQERPQQIHEGLLTAETLRRVWSEFVRFSPPVKVVYTASQQNSYRAAYEEGWNDALQWNNPRYRRQVRNEALDEAAKAVANHNVQGREWVRGSLFDTLANEAAARIRQLKSEPLKD